ncbi:MAG: molybdopterin-dependent oxidoreductase, partial [Sphingomonadaceae bacterium]|nr:molybdopterin-dependent oxidoreductase [Sphingomonadaceae bacterium]
GTKIVVIDPRRTETAEQADLHIAVEPDGDVALFNALLAEMQRRGLTDDAFMRDNVEAPEGFLDEIAEAQPGIPPSDFAALARLVADHPRMVTMFSQGANQSVSGTDKGNAIINLHLATGRINRIGTGPFSITGQPNAMGGREVGGLANMLASHLGFSDEERTDVAAFWGTERVCSGPGLKAVDMFRAIHDGRIRFLWVMATNPAVSLPNSGFVREALERCPTVVVSDVMADTDTGRFADVKLPALAWGEKTGTVTNSERRVSLQRALFPAPGDARADWDIIGDVARRLGHTQAFNFSSPAAIFREFAEMTQLSLDHGKKLDLTQWSELSDDGYAALQPFQWGGEHPLSSGFPTPTGKARIVRVTPAARAVCDAFPLRLNTARYRDQWHTMTRTGLSHTLSQHRPEPLVEVHPADSARYGLGDEALARIETASGSSIFRVCVSEGQREGEICVPMHWTDVMAGEGRSNRLPGDGVDPVSGQPGFKNTAARIEPVVTDWRAFLVSREVVEPSGVVYWTRSKVSGGWLYELAGAGAINADALLPDGERLEAADTKRGMRRIAVRAEDGAFAGALYITRSGELPPRDWIAGQLGESEASTVEVLAARPSTPLPDRGAIICVCHGIGEVTVREAVLGGAATVAAIGECTSAGTNCGSCRPAIAKLLETTLGEVGEAAE